MEDTSNPSICIPRMFNTISRNTITAVFTNLKLGEIDYIDIVVGHDFQRIFIYFKRWFSSSFAKSIKARFLDNEEIKIIYDDPWFWKCRLNRTKKNFFGAGNNRWVSRYNTRKPIIKLKEELAKTRVEYDKLLAAKDEEICKLRNLLNECMGDDALLRRKCIQQKAAKEHQGTSGTLFN